MGAISTALQACLARIENSCAEAGRGAGCARLLAVSKTIPAAEIRQAHRAGQSAFGESYLQEALPKLEQLADLPLEWHFIGPVQSNKTRLLATHFHWVHGIDREKVAQRLSEHRPPGLQPLNVCIQVNVSGEPGKHGVSPEQALALARSVATLANLCLRGFMAIPEASRDTNLQHVRFRRVADLLRQAKLEGMALDTLSMGMSDDLEAAILEGATIVRVGTAIFGARHYSNQDQEPAS